jgi:predicted TIM-barrel fold metal-dependent hydrolase
VPVVIDHMAGFDADGGLAQPGWRVLLELLAAGRTWVKLCAYRNLLGRDPALGEAFHASLLATRPDRLVWGSDWPHLRVTPEPDTHALLGWMEAWTPDPALRRAVRHDNPQALYG